MPTYQYRCEPCKVIYLVIHGMNDEPKITCPDCAGSTDRMISAPNLNLAGHSSPTEARHSRISPREERAREAELQKIYRTIWLPEPVKHAPGDE